MSNPKASTQKELLAKVGRDAPRVLVRDEMGKQRYKPVEEVGDKDEVVLNSDGNPVVMMRSPGRPKNAQPLDAPSEGLAELMRLRAQALTDDTLVKLVAENPESPKVLDEVMQALAVESAALEFERKEAERTGKPTSQISVRRVNVLKAINDAYLKRKEVLSISGVDMDSQAFDKIFEYIMETFTSAMTDAGLRAEMTETVLAKMATAMDDEDWRREANRRMLGG